MHRYTFGSIGKKQVNIFFLLSVTTATNNLRLQRYLQYYTYIYIWYIKKIIHFFLEKSVLSFILMKNLPLKLNANSIHCSFNLQHIKESLMVTILCITLIINISIVTKVFPKLWKHTIIIPIHKSVKGKTSFMARNLLVKNQLPQNVGPIINYLQ